MKILSKGFVMNALTAAILLSAAGMILYTWNDRAESLASAVAVPEAGTHLPLPVDWAANRRTLILVLGTKCQFCLASEPFYRRLTAKPLPNVHTLAVFHEERQVGQEYLKGRHISIQDVRAAPLAAVSARGTPTLILVDRNGDVIQSWLGQLTTGEEEKVLVAVGAKRGAGAMWQRWLGSL